MMEDIALTFLQDLQAHGTPKDLDLLLVNTDGDDKSLTLKKLAQYVSSLHGIEKIVSSGKFTVPDGVTKIYVSGCAPGGGGGAGGCRTNTAEFGGGGGGGGAGQSIIKQPLSVKPGEVIDIMIGSPGLGGKTKQGDDGEFGLDGGDLTFGSYFTLKGGRGGGAGGGGNNRCYGGYGGAGYPDGGMGNDGDRTNTDILGTGGGGAGASCSFGGGGGSVRSSIGGSGAGIPGLKSYGNGSGGGGGSTGINGNGGNGSEGLLIVEW